MENIDCILEEYWEKEHQEVDVALEARDATWLVHHRRMVAVEDQVQREDCLVGEEIVVDSGVVYVSSPVIVAVVRMDEGMEWLLRMGVFVQVGTVAEKHMERHIAAVLTVTAAHLAGNLDTQGSGNVDMGG